MISIIDDDESVRDATSDFVRSLGYCSVSFSCAEEYLRSERVRNTACIISDICMPGMSGVQLQERLIAEDWHTPIIFVTAFPDDAVRARVLGAGAVGYLSKPFTDESMIECLERALKGSSPGSAA